MMHRDPHLQRRAVLAGLGTCLLSSAARAKSRCVDVAPGVQGCSVGIDSRVAFQFASAQEASQWCWAACISMIFGYAGHPVAQPRIVARAFGTLANLPGEPWRIMAALNIPWVDDRGTAFQPHASVADLAEASHQLAADRPLIVGTQGHAMVLTAMDYRVRLDGAWVIDRLTVRDPFPYGRATGVPRPPGLGLRGRRVLRADEAQAISFLAAVW